MECRVCWFVLLWQRVLVCSAMAGLLSAPFLTHWGSACGLATDRDPKPQPKPIGTYFDPYHYFIRKGSVSDLTHVLGSNSSYALRCKEVPLAMSCLAARLHGKLYLANELFVCDSTIPVGRFCQVALPIDEASIWALHLLLSLIPYFRPWCGTSLRVADSSSKYAAWLVRPAPSPSSRAMSKLSESKPLSPTASVHRRSTLRCHNLHLPRHSLSQAFAEASVLLSYDYRTEECSHSIAEDAQRNIC